MITVRLFRKSGTVTGVKTSGHSGLAESGSDVLCAAVSTLVQTAYLAISDIYGKVDYKKQDGHFEFSVPEGHDAQVIIRAMQVGLQDLSSGYPQNLKLEEA
ncbi:MAG: ribosomal-processing cysteine protease Prp [Clostridiales bacterium]|nr:ribosomal-processing cysteine protease Prp [Clostridiales bacterium]